MDIVSVQPQPLQVVGEEKVATPAAPTPQSVASPSEWTAPTPGEVITSLATNNSYTMGEEIGEGSFGIVYGCVDFWNNSLAAKVLKPLKPYDENLAAAVGEINKLHTLRHPFITYVFDAFEYRKTFFIITERCHGPVSQLFHLPNLNPLTWIVPIARCLLQAVHFLHINQYAHQDIHAGNVFAAFAKDEILPDSDGAINFKLADLGVAKLFSEIDATNTRAQWMLPPEALDSAEFGPMDHRIDIYHCGLLFLQLAHKQELRFTADEIKAGKPREMALALEPPFNFALEKALRRHVQYRTADAMELWRDLNSQAKLTAPQPAATEGPPAQ